MSFLVPFFGELVVRDLFKDKSMLLKRTFAQRQGSSYEMVDDQSAQVPSVFDTFWGWVGGCSEPPRSRLKGTLNDLGNFHQRSSSYSSCQPQG